MCPTFFFCKKKVTLHLNFQHSQTWFRIRSGWQIPEWSAVLVFGGPLFKGKKWKENQIWELAAYHKHLLDSIKHGLMMSKYQELAVCLCHIYTQFAITSDAAAQRVVTRVGQVLETEPNPPVSAWASELIPTVIKKIKYPVLIYKHSLSKNQKLSYYYITTVLNFFQNPNNHLENYWVFASSFMKPELQKSKTWPHTGSNLQVTFMHLFNPTNPG